MHHTLPELNNMYQEVIWMTDQIMKSDDKTVTSSTGDKGLWASDIVRLEIKDIDLRIISERHI
jgi:hypothetical protein